MMRQLITILLVLIASAAASSHCSVHGDTHVLMSDGTSKFAHHSSGLFRVFATAVGTKRLDVQCEFTDRSVLPGGFAVIPDPQMSACRVSVSDASFPTCIGNTVVIRHDGTQQPGYGSIDGQSMPLASMSGYAFPAQLGVRVLPLPNNVLSVEVNWNGTFTQVVLAARNVQIHADDTITSCLGLCGTCAGPQMAPIEPQAIAAFIAGHAVTPQLAIQPPPSCQPINMLNNNNAMFPYPAYNPPSMADQLYTTPQFASQTLMLQVFAECAGGERTRLQYDPIFNSFVEDCMFDKSLGPGFEPSAKASLDAFVTWTESLMRTNRIARMRGTCAACIPVQWTDVLNTNMVLKPTVTMRKGEFGFPTRYTGTNNYELAPLMSAFAGGFNALSSSSSIHIPSILSLGLPALPQSLLSSPIIVTDDSHGIDTITWNPMPATSGGVCSMFDPAQRMLMDQIAGQYVQSGSTAQLVQMIAQGQMYSLCYAIACSQTTASPNLAQIAAMVTPAQLQMACPLTNNGMDGAINGNGAFNGNSFNGNGAFNGNTFNGAFNSNGQLGMMPNSQMMLNNIFNANTGMNGAFNGNVINGAFSGNGMMDAFNSGMNNGLNPMAGQFNPMNNGQFNNGPLNNGFNNNGMNNGFNNNGPNNNGMNNGFNNNGPNNGFNNNGMNNGFNTGMNNGFNNGMNNGFNNGMNNGFNNGMNNGFNNGMMNRFNNGNNNGQFQGAQNALNQIQQANAGTSSADILGVQNGNPSAARPGLNNKFVF